MRYFSYYKDKNLVTLSNSILKKYGIKTFHDTIKSVDELLEKHDKIAFFLFDGFGKSISEKLLSEDSFIRKHKFDTISSTFPPTTAAATNAFKSARYPSEIGWLGWTFKDVRNGDVIGMFTHRHYVSGEFADYDYSRFDFKTIFEMIKEHNKDVAVFENYPAELESNKHGEGFTDMEDMFRQADKFFKSHDKAFAYSYHLEPDHTLHGEGNNSPIVKEIAEEINERIEKFANENKDTLVIVFADHSHININSMFYDEMTELHDCVETIFSIEARAASFNVKPGKEEQFLKFYKEHLSNDYDIVSKEEVIKTELFGPTKDLKWVNELVGDYVLIALGANSIECNRSWPMKSAHAGGSKEENLINLYAINR